MPRRIESERHIERRMPGGGAEGFGTPAFRRVKAKKYILARPTASGVQMTSSPCPGLWYADVGTSSSSALRSRSSPVRLRPSILPASSLSPARVLAGSDARCRLQPSVRARGRSPLCACRRRLWECPAAPVPPGSHRNAGPPRCQRRVRSDWAARRLDLSHRYGGALPQPVRSVHQLARRKTFHQVAQGVGIEEVHQAPRSTVRPVSRSRSA